MSTPAPVTADLDALSQIIFSAVVSDICDRLGLGARTLPSGLMPLCAPTPVLLGWVRTAYAVPVTAVPSDPYEPEITLVDSLHPGDVVVADAGGSPAAFWGELFSAAATARGARGAIVSGLVRDVDRVRPSGFSLYALGSHPTDSNGRLRVQTQDQPLFFGATEVRSGDLVVADVDGVVTVPAHAAEDVARLAVEKVGLESRAHQLLSEGATLRQAWQRFGVL